MPGFVHLLLLSQFSAAKSSAALLKSNHVPKDLANKLLPLHNVHQSILSTPHLSLVHPDNCAAGLVETSTNLASVKLQAPTHTGPLAAHVTYSIVCCTRSSLMPALENVRQRIAKTARLCGASIALVCVFVWWYLHILDALCLSCMSLSRLQWPLQPRNPMGAFVCLCLLVYLLFLFAASGVGLGWSCHGTKCNHCMQHVCM